MESVVRIYVYRLHASRFVFYIKEYTHPFLIDLICHCIVACCVLLYKTVPLYLSLCVCVCFFFFKKQKENINNNNYHTLRVEHLAA